VRFAKAGERPADTGDLIAAIYSRLPSSPIVYCLAALGAHAEAVHAAIELARGDGPEA
jgi:hypothetical protein